MMASIPMKVAAKPEPGIEMNGELNPVAIALASMVLPVPGAPKRSRPRSRLPPRALELLARLPDLDDAPNLFLRLDLAADVVELDAPLRVARLERLDLRDVHERAAGRTGSRSWRRTGRRRRRPGSRAGRARIVPMPSKMKPMVPSHVPPRKSQTIVTTDDEEERDLEPEPPEPGPPAADDVLLAEGRGSRARTGSAPGSAGGRGGRRSRGRRRRSPAWRGAATTRPSRSGCVNQTTNAGAVRTRDGGGGTRQPPPALRELL